VIANAYYHRSYELDNPIEINIFPDKIEVLSFPGPLPPVDKAMLKQRRIVARNYRNRRVGDFLKELNLTEGRSTGFPTIYDSMHENGSPKPVFETDNDFGYFLVVLPVHHLFLEKPPTLNENALEILQFCIAPKRRSEILEKIGLSNHPKNYNTYITPLLDAGLLAYTVPDKPTSSVQKYITTAYGIQMLG
jgi:ATP-dependent DNA helicase RecG